VRNIVYPHQVDPKNREKENLKNKWKLENRVKQEINYEARERLFK